MAGHITRVAGVGVLIVTTSGHRRHDSVVFSSRQRHDVGIGPASPHTSERRLTYLTLGMLFEEPSPEDTELTCSCCEREGRSMAWAANPSNPSGCSFLSPMHACTHARMHATRRGVAAWTP